MAFSTSRLPRARAHLARARVEKHREWLVVDHEFSPCVSFCQPEPKRGGGDAERNAACRVEREQSVAATIYQRKRVLRKGGKSREAAAQSDGQRDAQCFAPAKARRPAAKVPDGKRARWQGCRRRSRRTLPMETLSSLSTAPRDIAGRCRHHHQERQKARS